MGIGRREREEGRLLRKEEDKERERGKGDVGAIRSYFLDFREMSSPLSQTRFPSLSANIVAVLLLLLLANIDTVVSSHTQPPPTPSTTRPALRANS